MWQASLSGELRAALINCSPVVQSVQQASPCPCLAGHVVPNIVRITIYVASIFVRWIL